MRIFCVSASGMNYEAVIGLEIHAELNTRTKMFCASLNDPDDTRPNVNVCPICMGHPGTLPVPNKEAIEKVIKVGLALNGEAAAFAQFDRKNYFYPDLPKGYQISQYQHPLVVGGYLDIPAAPLSDNSEITNRKSPIPNKTQNTNSKLQTRRIRIQRIHLEEDTGRLLHNDKTKTTLIDFNRAGVPLLELVTEPDMTSGSEVKKFGEELQKILRYLGASDADMEKGQLRVEVNVSLKPKNVDGLGAKVELKNINSFKFAADAVDFEIKRQTEALERGEVIRRETRGWDEKRKISVAQRFKEESQDYRYFPEPDIPPLRLAPSFIEEIRRSLPELPAAKLARFEREFGIDAKIAHTMVENKNMAGFFEATASELDDWLSRKSGKTEDKKPLRLAANYLTTDLARLFLDAGTTLDGALVTPENFAELITCIYEGRISSRTAKEVLNEMMKSGGDPSEIIDERKLWQISEGGEVDQAVEKMINANSEAVGDYLNGKTQVLQFLVGQVMKEIKGANPEAVRKLLEERLKS